jgi:NADH dehydrogenase FAD-containing subunit
MGQCTRRLLPQHSTTAAGPNRVQHSLAWQVPYDMLVVAVGSVNNTFGIKGVTEHTMAFRGIRDATALRRQVSECFERAALPHTPPEVGDDSVVTVRKSCRGAEAKSLL